MSLPSNGYAKIGRWLIASGVWAKLTGAAKGILQILAYHANDVGEAWPSITTICRENGSCRPTTLAALRALKDTGAISAKGKVLGSRGVIRYRLNFEPPATLWDYLDRPQSNGRGLRKESCPNQGLDQIKKVTRVPGQKTLSSTRLKKLPPELALRGTSLKGTRSAPLRSANADLRAAPGAPAREKPSAKSSETAMKETATTKGGTTASSSGVPDSFLDWLSAFADVFGKRYTPTSKLGREWAARYAAVVADVKATPDDLKGILPLAKEKRDRGFRLAEWPGWVLGDGLEELLNEKDRRPCGNGRGGAPIFRTGADLEEHKRRMRSVVERPTSDGR